MQLDDCGAGLAVLTGMAELAGLAGLLRFRIRFRWLAELGWAGLAGCMNFENHERMSHEP